MAAVLKKRALAEYSQTIQVSPKDFLVLVVNIILTVTILCFFASVRVCIPCRVEFDP